MLSKKKYSKLHEKTEHLIKFFISDAEDIDALIEKLKEFNEKMPEDKVEFFIYRTDEGDSLIFCTGSSNEYDCVGIQVSEDELGEITIKNLNVF